MTILQVETSVLDWSGLVTLILLPVMGYLLVQKDNRTDRDVQEIKADIKERDARIEELKRDIVEQNSKIADLHVNILTQLRDLSVKIVENRP